MPRNEPIVFEYSPSAKRDLKAWKKQHGTTELETIKKIQLEIVKTWPNPVGDFQPEELRYQLSGCVSRRINQGNRYVYRVNEDARSVYVLQCKGHYSDH